MTYDELLKLCTEAVEKEFEADFSRLKSAGMVTRAKTAAEAVIRQTLILAQAKNEAERERAVRNLAHARCAFQAYENIVALESLSLAARIAGRIFGTLAKSTLSALI